MGNPFGYPAFSIEPHVKNVLNMDFPEAIAVSNAASNDSDDWKCLPSELLNVFLANNPILYPFYILFYTGV